MFKIILTSIPMPEKEQEINIKLKIILFFQKNDRINFVAFFSIRDFF